MVALGFQVERSKKPVTVIRLGMPRQSREENGASEKAERESSALLTFDMRLPARVTAELKNSKIGDRKAVKDFLAKVNSTMTTVYRLLTLDSTVKRSACFDQG